MSIIQEIKRSVWLAALMTGGPVLLSKSRYELVECYDFNEADEGSWWGRFSDYPEISPELGKKLRDEIKKEKAKIDWDATEEMKDETVSIFNGTFADNTSLPVMVGILVLTNGSKYPWVCNFDCDFNHLKDVLELIKTWESKTDNQVLNDLCDKIDSALIKHKNLGYGFAYDMVR